MREAEARAQEAEARAREAEAAQPASEEGIPLWYGWGAGPAVLADGTDRQPTGDPQPAGHPAGAVRE